MAGVRAALFDFEGDGVGDVVFADEGNIYGFDRTIGAMKNGLKNTGLWMETRPLWNQHQYFVTKMTV